MKKYIRKRMMHNGNIGDFMDMLNKDFPDYRLVHFSVERQVDFPTVHELSLAILEKEVEECDEQYKYDYVYLYGDGFSDIIQKHSNTFPEYKIIAIHQHRPNVFEALLEKKVETKGETK